MGQCFSGKKGGREGGREGEAEEGREGGRAVKEYTPCVLCKAPGCKEQHRFQVCVAANGFE
eukprot:2023723-Rhodomonas_salina.1